MLQFGVKKQEIPIIAIINSVWFTEWFGVKDYESPIYENWESQMHGRKLFSSECLVTTTDGDEVLRIRLSIVVYDVHRRLIELVNGRVIQQEVWSCGQQGRHLQESSCRYRRSSRRRQRERGTCTCCLGCQGVNRCRQWNSWHPQQNTPLPICCRVLAAKAHVERIPVDFVYGVPFGAMEVPLLLRVIAMSPSLNHYFVCLV